MDDRFEKIKPYIKYLVPALIIIIILLFVFWPTNEYRKIEKEMVSEAQKYVSNNGISVTNGTYIEISNLGEIEGTSLCLKASGVIVKNNNGTLDYQPYLKCDDYETILNNNKNNIIDLNGDDVMILNLNEAYEEPMYTLKQDADVINQGKVLNQAGVYELYYDAYIDGELKERAVRTVIRVAGDKSQTITSLVDKSTPTINLEGDTNIYLRVGQKFSEPGYTAIDYTDGKISRKVKVDPNPKKLDNTRPATYVLVYSVTNSKGNTTVATRKVTFLENKSNVSIELTANTEEITNAVMINVKVNGSDFKKTYSPDRGFSTNYTYEVTSNGTYTFTVLDRYDNKISKQIEITNIDSIKPTGTCEAKVGASITQVNVTATDNKGIASYSYIIDGKVVETSTSNEYTVSDSATRVSVGIKDLAGNEITVSCPIEKILEITTPTTVIECRGDRTEYNNQIDRIVAANGLRTRATAAALGRYLSTEIGVKIPYFWAGGHWHFSWDGHDDVNTFKGVSPQWGCITKNYREFNGTDMLPAGIDCTGFVAWILFNAGFKKGEIGSFSGATWLTSLGGKKLEVTDFRGSTGKIQAGDIVWRTGHMGFVIDVDGETVTIAHEKGTTWGLVVEKYSSRTGTKIGGSDTFTKVSMLDNYYE